MIKKRILVVAPYPIANPMNGGQKRAEALVAFYRSIFTGVRFTGVYHRGYYEDHGPDDILLGDPAIIKRLDDNPFASEIIAGQAIDKDIHVRSRIAEDLKQHMPDIIHIEQPFPYLGLGPLLKELQLQPVLIFGSQNVEYKMKQKIYEQLGVKAVAAKAAIEQIKQLEERLSKDADLVIAVNREDAEAHKAMGARRVVIAPNGISKTIPTKAAAEHWSKFKRDNNIRVAATFVGSGHPPNWKSFLDMVGEDSSFLPDGFKIILGGGIAEYFKSEYGFGKQGGKHDKFWRGIVPLGRLSEDRLAGLLEASDMLLLPMTSGGGSNLKTAEAILSGKKIVATSYAFRGFEKYKKLPNIYMADTPAAFKQAMTEAASAELAPLTRKQAKLVRQVEWQHCLAPLESRLRRLVRPGLKSLVKRHVPGPAKRAAGKILRPARRR